MFFSRITLASILIVSAYLVITSSKRVKKVKVRHGPAGMSHEDATNCSEFAKFGRFNPYSVINEKWFVFYYWAPIRTQTTYIFTAPSSNHTKKLKKLFEGNCVLPVQWHVRQLLMEDNNNLISLLVERSDRGEYWQYPVARVRKGQKITPIDIRLKQTGDNRLLGLFDCVADTLIVMSKLNDVPPKGRLHEEASRLGYRGTKGKSYLYQGHEWGPVGEADEDHFWERRNDKTISKDTSTEDKSSEGSSKEAEQPTNKPEHSKAKKPKPKKGTALGPGIPEDDETCAKVMPELWNDPEPNPNPDNLLTKEDLNHVDSLIINDNLAIEGPEVSTVSKQESQGDKELEFFPENDKQSNYRDKQKIETPYLTDNNQESKSDKEFENTLENGELHDQKVLHKRETSDSTDNKQENNTDKKSENPLKNRELRDHKDVHEMETPDSIDNKQESNTGKESENPPDNQKLLSHKDVHEMETPDLIDNKQESNADKESENPPENDNPHNHKVCRGTTEPDKDDNCVVCFKSQLNYPSDESYAPDSARSMPDLKNNEDAPPKDVIPRFKVGGTELLPEEEPRTKVPIPNVPSAIIPCAEVRTSNVPSAKSPHIEVPIPKVQSAITPSAEVPTSDVPSTKSPHTEVPIPKVPAKTPSEEIPTPKVPSPKTHNTEVPSDKTPITKVPTQKVPHTKTPRAKVPDAKVARSPAPQPQEQTNSSTRLFLSPRSLEDLENASKVKLIKHK